MTSVLEACLFRRRISRQAPRKLLLLLIAMLGANQAWQCLSQGLSSEAPRHQSLSQELEKLTKRLGSDVKADRVSAASELAVLYDRCAVELAEVTKRSFTIDGRPPEPEVTRLISRFRSPVALDLCVENCDAVVVSDFGGRFDAFDRFECSKAILSYRGDAVPAIYRYLRSCPADKLSDAKVVLLSAVLRDVYGREIAGEKIRVDELIRSLNLEAAVEGLSTSAKRNFERVSVAVREKRSVYSLK